MVQVTENTIIYLGNGSTTEFPYTFQIIDPTDIKVYIVNPEGVETLITSDYYVDMSQQEVHYPGYAPGAAEPGSETPPILPVGWKIILYRQLPIDQQSVLDNNWPFKEIEHMVDKSRIIEQQLAGDLKRALKISLQFPNLDITVPVGANKSLRWNSDGTKLELTVDPADVLPVAQSLLAATQAARDALLMRPGYLAVESSIDKIDTIAADLTNLDNVADNIAVIAPVGAAIDQVEEVADDLAKINGVHDNLNNINAVYSIKDDISAVAEISLDVSNVSTIKTDIQSVATNIDNIINVAGNLAPVKIVGDNINSILTVNSNLPNINVVANNKANIDNVATNITGVNTVATNMNNVLVVANSKANIDAVALNKTNIDTIATNLTSIQAVVSNLPAILAALDYALLAKQWAIGDPTEPEDGSAKYWAFQSHADQMQADWDVTDPTDVRYIKNKPAKLPEDHSDVTTKYGGGTNEKYGHVRLLDNIIHAWATPASFPVAYCKGITYGNNKFVAVGANGMITTSNDGILWSEPVQVSTNQWQCVTYGNNKFVAVANGGLSATSIDGINWTIHSYYSTPNRKGISYGNNRFVVVGQDAWLGKASVFYSSDGTTWTNGNVSRIEGYSDLHSVTYGNNKFVAVGANGMITTSNDGILWAEPIQVSTIQWQCVTYGNNKFVAVGANGMITTSNDGILWSEPVQVSTIQWQCVTYGNNKFVAVGANGMITTSNDGILWSEPIQVSTNQWQCVIYGNNKFVAVTNGANGFSSYWMVTFISSTLSLEGLKALAQSITYIDGTGATVTKKFLVLPDD